MPNHVANHISLQGDPEKIRSMLEAIQSDELGVGSVDFNKIIPMPKSLNIEAGSRTDRGLKAYRDFIEVYTFGRSADDTLKALENIPAESEKVFLRQRTDIRREEWELGKTAWNNIRQFGTPTWYEWCVRNWGTKWNAYGYDEGGVDYHDGDSLRFQTAWSAPHPVLEKLTEMFPDIELEHEWADEDIGQNCGRYSYKAGERIEEYFPEGEKEAVFNALLAHLDSIGNHFDTGIMATPLLLKVLSDNGRADIAFRLMNQREIPGFGYVMDDRYSCLWERWEGKASRCHPMFGSVVAWFYRTLAGIRYDEAEPGMKHIVIAPQPVGGLTYCSGSYQSLYGPVRSDWRIEADSFELTVEVPVNTTATVILPDGKIYRNVGSGIHRFASPLMSDR